MNFLDAGIVVHTKDNFSMDVDKCKYKLFIILENILIKLSFKINLKHNELCSKILIRKNKNFSFRIMNLRKTVVSSTFGGQNDFLYRFCRFYHVNYLIIHISER